MKKLPITSFVNPLWIDKAIIETNDPNNFAPPVNTAKTPDLFCNFKNRFGGRANTVTAGSSQVFKAALVEYIVQELPKIKTTYALSDLVARSGNNFQAVIIDPTHKDLLDALSKDVQTWLSAQKDTESVRELLTYAKNSVPYLIEMLAPEVTAFLNANPGIAV